MNHPNIDSRSSASADALIEIDGVGDSGHGRDVKYAKEELPTRSSPEYL